MTTITQVIEIAGACLILIFMLVLSVNDVKAHKIPNKVLCIMLPCVAVCVACEALTTKTISDGLLIMADRLCGAMFGFAILLLCAFITNGGIGGGDIKLAGVLGLAVGIYGTITILLAASVIGGIAGVIQRKRNNADYKSLAFVPFMTAGYVIAEILRYLMNWSNIKL